MMSKPRSPGAANHAGTVPCYRICGVPEGARSERLAYGHYRVAISGPSLFGIPGALHCSIWRSSVFGVRPLILILILSLAADLAEELKRSRRRRGKEREKRGGGRREEGGGRGHHHITNGSGNAMSDNVR